MVASAFRFGDQWVREDRLDLLTGLLDLSAPLADHSGSRSGDQCAGEILAVNAPGGTMPYPMRRGGAFPSAGQPNDFVPRISSPGVWLSG